MNCETLPIKQLITALIIAILVSINVFAGEDRTFDKYAHETINDINKALIDFGKCTNVNDCTIKNYILFNPVSQGIDLHIYNVTEEELVQKIFSILTQQYHRLPPDSSLHARFISSTKEADLKRSFFEAAPVFAEIHMQEKNKPNKAFKRDAKQHAPLN